MKVVYDKQKETINVYDDDKSRMLSLGLEDRFNRIDFTPKKEVCINLSSTLVTSFDDSVELLAAYNAAFKLAREVWAEHMSDAMPEITVVKLDDGQETKMNGKFEVIP